MEDDERERMKRGIKEMRGRKRENKIKRVRNKEEKRK